MKNIVVGTDGSEHANRAVRKAAELAKLAKAQLTIVHVQDARRIGELERQFLLTEYYKALPPRLLSAKVPSAPLPEPDWSDAIKQVDNQAASIREAQSDRILEVAQRFAEEAGVVTLKTVSARGDAAQQIIATAQSSGADLIVIGRRGLGALSELLLGSVSQKVLHSAGVDVLVAA